MRTIKRRLERLERARGISNTLLEPLSDIERASGVASVLAAHKATGAYPEITRKLRKILALAKARMLEA